MLDQPSSSATTLELGVIGNGTVGALVDARGRFVWWCLPAFDGDPAFCSLLSPRHHDAGWFDVVLDGESGARQHYLENSAILVTRLDAVDGSAIVIACSAKRASLKLPSWLRQPK